MQVQHSYVGPQKREPTEDYLDPDIAELHPEGAPAILMGSRVHPRADKNLVNNGYSDIVDLEHSSYADISGIHPKGAPAMLMVSRVFPTVGRNPGSTDAATTGSGPEGSPAVLMGSRVSPRGEKAALTDDLHSRVGPVLLMATQDPPCGEVNKDTATTSDKQDAR